MPHFFYHPLREKARIVIKGKDLHHIRNVLRLKPGDEITLWDASGQEFSGQIIRLEPSQALVALGNRLATHKEPSLDVILGQALPKGNKMDLIITKATELGVTGIVPFLSQRTVPRLSAGAAADRLSRWNRLAYEAAKQCGRLSLPKVEPLCPFSDALAHGLQADLKLILWEEEKEAGLKSILNRKEQVKSIFFLVGPEGGFTKQEVALAKDKGFLAAGLGPRILRTETVALALISIFQHRYGDLG